MFQGVGGAEAIFYIRVLKESCYISSFFTYVCKDSPFLICVFRRILFLIVFLFPSKHLSYNYYSLIFHSFSSFLLIYSSVIGHVLFILLTRFLIADILCSNGWHESLCVIWSVVVSFLYLLNSNIPFILQMVMSRTFIDELISFSMVSVKLVCNLLNSFRTWSVCVVYVSYKISMSSTYLQ
jgi:hypothetical protein